MKKNALRWIRSEPTAFCNTQDKKVLLQVLNDYDQETADFYRWHVHYTQEELSTLIQQKTKMDFGCIVDLIPLERGKSGRISRLKIVGTKRSFIIGKELEIRRTLSETHLYSSAFVVEKSHFENRHSTAIRYPRSRLGTRSRALSDRCCCDGSRWLSV